MPSQQAQADFFNDGLDIHFPFPGVNFTKPGQNLLGDMVRNFMIIRQC